MAGEDWAKLTVPTWGDPLLLSGTEVAGAAIDAKALQTFLREYAANADAAAFASSQAIFRENSLIPMKVLAEFRAILAPEKSVSNERDAFYRLTFGEQAQLSLGIDPERGIIREAITSERPNFDPPTRHGEKIALPDALSHFRNYLLLTGADPSVLVLEACYYGGQSIILSCRAAMQDIMPAPSPSHFLMDAHLPRSTIEPFDPRFIADAVSQEFEPVTKQKRAQVIKSYLALRAPGSLPISSAKEIPGSKRRPIDSDLAAAIKPLHTFTDSRKENVEVAVLYAYEQVGGVVTRYRFTFKEESLEGVFETVLARDVGSAEYYLNYTPDTFTDGKQFVVADVRPGMVVKNS